ncbi:hypothetical protein NG829_01155 [Xanthomonas sacchari]|uniref:hypothetical protein n=1 Tax=Xanthomonas TaxID=338 RepID=UPI0011E47D19|nr:MULTISPECIES: hypothetical protein [Xanthomonas]MDQ7757888.1 hypothetical protein [Xanthomonas sontii]TYD32410.1 hypothetical protein CEK63_18230 [Xanthomonas sontii]UYK80962.1 hypothetical protein NG829_01155 [Xanthomonas sacchari]UZK05498.1 hypothetical protein CJ027_001230 [Xanthomonas sontii]
MHLSPDLPLGRPSFALSEDEFATVVDLLCQGVATARSLLTPGMLEVPITLHVKKAMRRLKKELGLSNLEITGEFELLDMGNNDPEVLGRIDIVLRFLHQFGDEEAYLGVECKRVGAGEAALNQRYVTQGVNRYVTGQYAAGHYRGVMLGYVLKLPSAALVEGIDARIRATYGEDAKLVDLDPHAESLSIHEGNLTQGTSGHVIRLTHVFVDTTPAASTTAASS